MPETIGLAILTAVGATEVVGVAGLGTLATTTVAGVSAATIVGTAAIIGVSIGLQYALNNPEVPKQENGGIPLKQAVPPRQRGFWTCRLAGYYMLFISAGGDSQDMLAFHQGRIEEVLQIYLHDVAVATVPDPTHETIVTVSSVGADKYNGPINIQIFYGYDTQNSCSLLNPTSTSGVWTLDHQGKGIACMAMYCYKKADAAAFTKCYPQGLPLPSVVAKCTPVFDPRDVTQTRDDPLTWKASPNPVLQLMFYLTEADGGMGEDFDELFPDDVLAQWMEEADLCDEDVGGRPRYASAGFYQFDNSPESVIGRITSTCDGWLAEDGEGRPVLTVGVYREPTDPPLTSDHLFGWSVNHGIADEEAINQLDVKYTSPVLGYVTDQAASIRDEDAISLSGIVRSKPLDLSFVQNADQAEMLGERAMQRVNPAKSGTLVAKAYGLRYLGKRWIKLQLPEAGPALANCVIEIQDKGEVDLLGGTVTFHWNLVDPVALAAL